MIDTVEKAERLVKNFDGDAPPATNNARLNFLIDVVRGIHDLDDWDEMEPLYEEEVEAYDNEDVSIEPYEIEELEKYI